MHFSAHLLPPPRRQLGEPARARPAPAREGTRLEGSALCSLSLVLALCTTRLGAPQTWSARHAATAPPRLPPGRTGQPRGPRGRLFLVLGVAAAGAILVHAPRPRQLPAVFAGYYPEDAAEVLARRLVDRAHPLLHQLWRWRVQDKVRVVLMDPCIVSFFMHQISVDDEEDRDEIIGLFML